MSNAPETFADPEDYYDFLDAADNLATLTEAAEMSNHLKGMINSSKQALDAMIYIHKRIMFALWNIRERFGDRFVFANDRVERVSCFLEEARNYLNLLSKVAVCPL